MSRRIYSPLLKDLSEGPPVEESDRVLIEGLITGDASCGYKLLKKHHRMILRVLIDATGGKWFDDDCIHAGAIGLFEAAKKWDPGRGTTFLTYATWYIRKYLYLEIGNEVLPAAGVFLGRDIKDKLFRFIGLQMSGYSDEEILRRLNVNSRTFERLKRMAYETSAPVSLTPEADEVEDYGQSGVPISEGIEESYVSGEVVRQIEDIVNSMPGVERLIVCNILGICGYEVSGKKETREALKLDAKEFGKLKRKAMNTLKVETIRRGLV